MPEAVNNISVSTDGIKLFNSVSVQSKVMLYLNCGYQTNDPSNLKYVIKDAIKGTTIETLPAIISIMNCAGGHALLRLAMTIANGQAHQ